MLFVLTVLFYSPHVVQTSASSSEGDPAPPSGEEGSSGGGGGGVATLNVFTYYVPLIFNSSNPLGSSNVTVWTHVSVQLLTSFSIDGSGTNSLTLNEPTKVSFTPTFSPGLTNGSFITTTAPCQVIGERYTEDIGVDRSFSYTILPARMMGFEYRAPFDGSASIYTRSINTTLRFAGVITPVFLPQFQVVAVTVTEGQYFNATTPVLVAFYSTDGPGVSATLGVPSFLRGQSYLLNADLNAESTYEQDLSYIKVIPDSPTEIYILYEDGSTRALEIFGTTRLVKDNSIRGISSRRSDILVLVESILDYGKLLRRSSVVLFAAPEMRAGELFLLPDGYSTHIVVLNPRTNFTVAEWYSGNYTVGARNLPTYNVSEVLTFGTTAVRNVIYGNHSLFVIATSPGYVGHPMAPSASFVVLPLNTQTLYRNTTTVLSTWYRFANLAVERVTLHPESPEELTGQMINVRFIANGSLPASSFRVRIEFFGEVHVNEEIQFLAVNKTLDYSFSIFLDFGLRELNITASIDTLSVVTEIDEDDNIVMFHVVVNPNIRIIITASVIIGLLVIFVPFLLTRRWLNNRRIEDSRYDAILSIENEETRE